MKLKPHKINPLGLVAVLLTAVSILSARADYPATVLSHNPLAYWRFNETVASPPLNKVTNSGTLGSAGDGYALYDATKGEPGALGLLGNSVRLINGGNAVGYCGSKVDMPYNAGLNPKAPFSVEFWTKPNHLGGDATGASPLSCFNPNGYGAGNRSGWLFYLSNGGVWTFRLGLTSGYAAICTAVGGTATIGTWQHVAATFDGLDTRLYVNGALVKVLTNGTGGYNPTAWKPNPEMALRIGGTPLTGTYADGPAISATGVSGNRGYDGWVDEVAIFPSVLSPSTIAAHYNAATTNTDGYGAQILTDSPVGYWRLDEPAVTPPIASALPIAANSGSLGSAVDGTNMWGTLAAQNGADFDGFGAGNKAVLFDGENGYIGLPNDAGLHFSGQITMMAWVKPSAKDFFRNIIGHGWDGNYAETFLRISRSDDGSGGGVTGKNFYEVGSCDGSYEGYITALYEIPPGDIGNWVFLVGTFDGSNWNLYRNGVLVDSVPSFNGVVDVADNWSIGSRSAPGETAQFEGGDDLLFGGMMDEPAIFNTALSAGDIAALYSDAQAKPQITSALQSPSTRYGPNTTYSGNPLSLSVWAEGSGTLSYSWTSNGVPVGGNSTNLSLGALQAGVQTIALVATSASGSATSSITYTVIDAPAYFLQQPKPTTRFTGNSFNFSVNVEGSLPVTYQWKSNSVAISGATSSSYSAVASLGLNGLNYSCTASNSGGLSDSDPAVLTVNPIPSGYGGVVIGNSPIGYWRLGEASGTIAHDGIGGNDGTFNSTTLGLPGYSILDSDTAVSFAGPNSYVGSISGTAINFTGHTNFTLEAWVKGPAGQADESTIIAKGIGSTGTTRTEQFALDVAAGVYRFFVTRGTTFNDLSASVGPNDTWQHVVGVYDDAAGQMYIYVNGENQGSRNTLGGSGLNTTATQVTIGSKRLGNDPNYDGTFEGSVDEVAIYNVALDGTTIQAHYAAAYGSSLAPLISIQPSPTTNYSGLATKLNVVAAGTVPLQYTWKKNNAVVTDNDHITGANSATLAFSPLIFDDAGNYSVSITNPVSGTNSITVPLAVLAPPASPPAIPGLVLHLTFDGNSLADATGRGNDGTGKHSTITTTNTVSPAANIGGNPSFYFVDGPFAGLGTGLHYSTLATNNGPSDPAASTAYDDYYVSLGVRPDLKFGSDSFSVAYWIRLPVNYDGGDLPFFTDGINGLGGDGYVFAPAYGYGTASPNPTPAPLNQGSWASSVYGAGLGIRLYGEPLGNINDGNWHNLIHVFDRTAGTAVTYLDGAVGKYSKIAGTTLTAAGDIDNANPANIGQDPTGRYGEQGSADIDDLGVWRKALTPLEAGSIYIAAISNQLSYASVPITFGIQSFSGTQLTLEWTFGTLQSATIVKGPYTDVAGAVSPYTVTSTAGIKYYRVRY